MIATIGRGVERRVIARAAAPERGIAAKIDGQSPRQLGRTVASPSDYARAGRTSGARGVYPSGLEVLHAKLRVISSSS